MLPIEAFARYAVIECLCRFTTGLAQMTHEQRCIGLRRRNTRTETTRTHLERTLRFAFQITYKPLRVVRVRRWHAPAHNGVQKSATLPRVEAENLNRLFKITIVNYKR
jgi:hypothetical protein